MLKQLIAFTFLLSFSFQLFSKAIIVANYYTNTSSFAKNCENKARPQLHCNGKCQFMKKLKQEDKKDQQNPERRMENKHETAISSRSFFTNLAFTKNNKEQTKYADFNFSKTIAMPRSVFHPPSA